MTPEELDRLARRAYVQYVRSLGGEPGERGHALWLDLEDKYRLAWRDVAVELQGAMAPTRRRPESAIQANETLSLAEAARILDEILERRRG